MITLSALCIYPVKGGRGIPLPAVELDDFGPRDDRRWMLVDQHCVAVTQRQSPRLCLLQSRLAPDSLTLEAPGMPPLELPRHPAGDGRVRVGIWRDQCDAVDLGEAAAQWCSRFLERRCRLVHMPDSTFRRTDPNYDPAGSRVGFADAFPMLLVGQGSLDHLNTRLPAPLPMNRFRPNLVVTGAPPHAEDGWRTIAIGGLTLELVKPCARCTVPTTDQETGERGPEPLRVLATYRKQGSGVFFGMNLVHRDRGILRVGDVVEVGCRV